LNKTLIAVLAMLVLMGGCSNPYTDVPVASSATISQQWSEITPPQPLQWTRPAQELSFHIDTPHEQSTSVEIVGPNGQHCAPDVEFVTTSGKDFPMDAHGFGGDIEMYFWWKQERPEMEPIKTFRVRNCFPIHVSKIIWRGYDPREVKR